MNNSEDFLMRQGSTTRATSNHPDISVHVTAKRESVVNRLLLALQQSRDPQNAIQTVVEAAGEECRVDRCRAVIFGDLEYAEFVGEWCAESVTPFILDGEVARCSPVKGWSEEHHTPLVVPDVFTHPLASGREDWLRKLDIKSYVAIPILHQRRGIGVLSFHQTRYQRAWTGEDVDLFTAIATHIGPSLDNIRLIEKLREANRLKDQFLANLSHELRTPLISIVGWAGLLRENSVAQSDDEITEGLETIDASGDELLQLINDLLDLTVVQQGSLVLDRSSADVNELVNSAISAFDDSIKESRFDLHLSLDEHLPRISADKKRLEMVIWNLFGNAIKFTPPGGDISIRTYAGSDGDREQVIVEVEDTGAGIAKDFLPLIWDRFRQFDGSASRKHGGLGIGLAYVKDVVEAHGGTARAANNHAAGATFKLTLPLASEDNGLAV